MFDSNFTKSNCIEECKGGFYNSSCTEVCGQCVNGSACNKVNGHCTDCLNNFMHPFCKGIFLYVLRRLAHWIIDHLHFCFNLLEFCSILRLFVIAFSMQRGFLRQLNLENDWMRQICNDFTKLTKFSFYITKIKIFPFKTATLKVNSFTFKLYVTFENMYLRN